MKKGAYIKARTAVWVSRGWLSSTPGGITPTAGDRAAQDAEAAEAAGVAWDPEEEPLPERLEMDPDGSVRDGAGGVAPYIASMAYGYGRGGGGRMTARLILREMVRRYNLWEAVRREAEEGLSYLRKVASEVGEACYTGSKFRTILSLMDDDEGR